MASISSLTQSLINNLNTKTSSLHKSLLALSTGSRLNRASDDAAGHAIADSLRNDAIIYDQVSRNVNDGGSVAAIRDGALESITDISGRLQELAVQSANGTLNDTQRSSLNQEFQQLTQEANRIVSTTQFNGVNVFSESTAIQIGADSSASSQLSLTGDSNLTSQIAALSGVNVSSQSSARNAIDTIKNLSEGISQSRGQLGAQVSRLDTIYNQSQTYRINAKEAESRIRDADIASETSKFISARIGQQASVALLSYSSKSSADISKKFIV